MQHNEINQKHKVGKVPRAILITQGQFCLHSAGGTLSMTPATKHSNKAATGRIQRISASRETALLICGPGGCNVGLLVLIQR